MKFSKVIDMKCGSCGETMDLPNEFSTFYVETFSDGKRFRFYKSENEDKPVEIDCSHCHSNFILWFPGVKTKKANIVNVDFYFGGDVHNTNIVIGDNVTINNKKG